MSNHDHTKGRERGALVIFPGALGDLICLLPALDRITRRSGRAPEILCRDSLAPLLRASGVARPRSLDGPEGAWLFSGNPPAEAKAAFGGFSSIECFTGSGVPEVTRNLHSWVGSVARVHAFRPSSGEHLARHYLRCVGAEPATLPSARLPIPPAVLDPARHRLRSLADRRPVLLIHPGSGGMNKRWSRRGFAAIASWWRRERGSAVFVLGPAERGEEKLWSEARGIAPLQPDLVELAGLLAACDAYCGNDSGVSHLAGAVGARGVAIFGPTDPKQWRPLGPGLRACRPRSWSAFDDVATAEMLRSLAHELDLSLAESST